MSEQNSYFCCIIVKGSNCSATVYCLQVTSYLQTRGCSTMNHDALLPSQ